MVALPAVRPVTVPSVATVATVEALLLQTPPVVASETFVVVPAQIVEAPVTVIAAGGFVTVMGVVTTQVPMEYEIVVEPSATPVTTPPDVTDAMSGLSELQIPPGVGFERGAIPPRQTLAGDGEIGPGPVVTLIVFVTLQPPTVYEITADPTLKPVTVAVPPVPVTVATVDEPVLHTPPAVPSVRVTELPEQMVVAVDGEIATGALATVTVADAEQAPSVYVIVVVPGATG